MTIYQEARVKLTNTPLNKLKSAVKSNTGTISRLNNKNFEDEELPYGLFLTTRQTIKMINAVANNMSTDSEIIQVGGSFGSWLGNLGKKALSNIAMISL